MIDQAIIKWNDDDGIAMRMKMDIYQKSEDSEDDI